MTSPGVISDRSAGGLRENRRGLDPSHGKCSSHPRELIVRIAFDVSPALATRPSGIGRYVESLSVALGKLDGVRLIPARHPGRLLRRWQGRYGRVFSRAGGASGLNGLLLAGVDLAHWTKNEVTARSPLPCVVTVHDCFDLYFGLDRVEEGGWAAQVSAKYRALRTVPRRILADSRYTADMLSVRGGVDPARIRVVPLGVEEGFRHVSAEDRARLAERLGLSRPYFLFVGSLCRRKNVDGLLVAWRHFRERSAGPEDLILCGGLYEDAVVEVSAALAEPGLGVRKVDVRGTAELAALYAGARALVWPSWAEGFGLPVLEAMATGTPVIAGNASSLPEVSGDAAILVDPACTEDIVSAMARVSGDAALREDLSRRGLAQSAAYTWERTAAETLAVYREALAPEA